MASERAKKAAIAAFPPFGDGSKPYEFHDDVADLLDRFAEEAVREEREACVKLADEWREHVPKNGLAFTHGWEQSALTIAEEIRARGEEEADDGE